MDLQAEIFVEEKAPGIPHQPSSTEEANNKDDILHSLSDRTRGNGFKL